MLNFTRLKITLLLLLLCTAALPALTLHQNITVDIDGGAVISYAYYVPVKSLWLCRELHRQFSIPDFSSRENARRHFEAQAGIKLESYYTVVRGENSITQFTVRVNDIAAALKSGIFGKLDISKSENIAGDLIFSARLPVDAAASSESAGVLKLLGGLEMILRLSTPTEIIESTGHKEAFNRHSWTVKTEDILQGKFPEIKARW